MADGMQKPRTQATHEGITDALIAAQMDFTTPAKTTKGARAKYAPLDEVIAAVRPVLNQHGIAVFQTTSIADDMLVVLTTLQHTSGEKIEGVYPVCALGKAPQDTGSAMTYARRYALLAICGVHPEDEDDDGEKGASVAGRNERPPAPKADANLAKLMADTLGQCETQDELSVWLGAHKDNMGKVDERARSSLRAEYARLLKALPREMADA